MQATALQLRSAYLPTTEEWERLPWLFDEPKRFRRRPRAWILALIVLLIAADALGSYTAGQLSVRHGWQVPALAQTIGRDAAVRASVKPLSPEDSLRLARQLSEVQKIGFQWRRPNVPY
jgi:hypothetical protein